MTEGVHDQPEGELGHILRRFIGIGGQPGFTRPMQPERQKE